MALQRLTDVVVILPGIMGSVLQKDDRDLWAVSGQAVWQLLRNRVHSSLEQLILKGDDPQCEDLGDGITATRLMPNAHYVPGFCWIDGYSDITNMIINTFQVERGDIRGEKPANFLEFPYDWRRDNRATAGQLKRLVDEQLFRWRRHIGHEDAKLILVAHSMGGLIARYYLEVLEGWRDCKALITFGTPYRGSVKALNFLVNGCKKAFVDLTEVMRSFTSAHQLLPIYEMVCANNVYGRVAETDGIPHITRTRAEQALAFHRSIEAAVATHRKDAQYTEKGYKIIPVVGTRQPTFQSAELHDGCLTITRGLPPGIDEILNDGDGTVPRLSAIPIEMSEEFRDSFFAERHGSLQKNASVLDDLRGRLQQMQVTGLREIRGPEIDRRAEGRAAIGLDMDDFYDADEPVTLRAELINTNESSAPPEAIIERADNFNIPLMRRGFHKTSDGWMLELGELEGGVYRVEVRTSKMGPGAPAAVHDLFMVAGEVG
jgi:pimeloyl-ACP methyl ester carboxylesterase